MKRFWSFIFLKLSVHIRIFHSVEWSKSGFLHVQWDWLTRKRICCLLKTSLLLLNLNERISWRPSPRWRHDCEWKIKTFQHLCSRAFSSCKQKLMVSWGSRVIVCNCVYLCVCECCQEDLYTAAGLPPSDQDHPDFNTQSRRKRCCNTHSHAHKHTITHYANVAMELLTQRHTSSEHVNQNKLDVINVAQLLCTTCALKATFPKCLWMHHGHVCMYNVKIY